MTDPPGPRIPARRVGLLGGTFDPPHVGHLIVAQDVAEELELDRVRFEVAARSPLKPDLVPAPAELRARMVEAAVALDDRLEVGRSEIGRGGASYTVDTLRALKAADPAIEWYLIIGSDQWKQFDQWREPEELGRLATVVVMNRAGQAPGESGSRRVPVACLPVEVTRVDVSSTEVRERVRAGRSVRYWVPEPVRRIIEESGLYRDVRPDDPGR